MDIRKFRENTPGRIITIEGGEHAYIPNALPPRWKFPEKLWPLLLDARENLALLEGVGRTLPDSSLLLRPIQRREAIQSSRLEGTYATPRELLLFEIDQKQPTGEDDPANDWREVFNYQQSLQYGTTTELPLSLRLIRELHRILCTGVRGREHAPGEFRRIQVAIGPSFRFVPPPPQFLDECLDSFEKYLHAPNEFDPLVDCFIAHYQFEAIHPFRDGNGRVGRVLLAMMIQQRCKLTKPWLYLSEFFEKNRNDYRQFLFDVNAKVAWTDWVEFCLRGTSEQAKATIQRCENLRIIKDDYMQRLGATGGRVRLNKIVDDLFSSPIIELAQLPERLEVTYPTAKSDVERLVDVGILAELPDTPVRTFYAPEIYRVAYGDID
ncbi:MAG: Fic/DOC family N-terminal domain-containing protein [Pirellulales bacterium]